MTKAVNAAGSEHRTAAKMNGHQTLTSKSMYKGVAAARGGPGMPQLTSHEVGVASIIGETTLFAILPARAGNSDMACMVIPKYIKYKHYLDVALS